MMFWLNYKISLVFTGLVGLTRAAQMIGSSGFTQYDSPAFTLELDNATQVATRLIAKSGLDAGSEDFNFLISPQNRSTDGFWALGDLQLRYRQNSTEGWTDVSSHVKRTAVESRTHHNSSSSNGAYLASSDITPALQACLSNSSDASGELPFIVTRLWSADETSLTLSFNITNTASSSHLELGGIGIPTPWNNNWEGKDQNSTWTQHVVTDPAPALDAGYTITNRLTGAGPTLLTIPARGQKRKTPLEAYRLNYAAGTVDKRWSAAFTDNEAISYSSEGIFSWWTATKGLAELDVADAKQNGFESGRPWNEPSSVTIKPGASHLVGLRFVTASGPRAVEDRLRQFQRPVMVGVPGLVVSQGENVRLLVRDSRRPEVINANSSQAIAFEEAKKINDSTWMLEGQVDSDVFGETRVSLSFEDGDVATAHYTVIKPHADQLDGLGDFRFSRQYFTQPSDDYFNRTPSIISYDHSTMKQVTDDPRSWVAGLSDEGGSGAYVSAAAKQYGRPDADQVAKLEQFATRTLWGHLQNPNSSDDSYAGVRKSLFFYDPALVGDPSAGYQSSIDRAQAWDRTEAERLDRSYNYPHPIVVYWTLYRLARNYKGLVTVRDWNWYLDRCVDTISAMEKHAGLIDSYAQFGLMEGTYFLRVLQDLQREMNRTEQASSVEKFMKRRSDIWQNETYPYASEFPWDNTGQEEVYEWSRYFGHNATADKTVETLMAIMPSVPHWGYSGAGRDLWDCLYACKAGPGARIERILHHYKGSQSSLVLMDAFLANPKDVKMLRAGYGGLIGPLASILSDGFGSSAYHTRQDYLNWDPLSGDSGVNMALYTLNARAVYVDDGDVGGHAGFGAQVSVKERTVHIKPTDGLRQRLFLAPIALYIELDAGKIAWVTYDLQTHQVDLTLDPADQHTAKGRVRLTTTAHTTSSAHYTLDGRFGKERDAWVVPLTDDATRVTLRRNV